MADDADLAAQQIEANELRNIKYSQSLASKPLPTSENCLWCNSKTKNGARWCNRECCDYWEKYGGQ
jgi:hypothetical protein